MNNASPSRKFPALPFSFGVRVLGVVLLLGCSLASSFAASSFTGIGLLPGKEWSEANAISGDGKAVVGQSGGLAFRWTAACGMVSLGHLSGVAKLSQPFGASEALSSTTTINMVDFADLPGASFTSVADGISADGSVVVGTSSESASGIKRTFRGFLVLSGCDFASGSEQAFRWTALHGMVGLGALPGCTNSSAQGVSNDGSVVVGGLIGDDRRAFRWTTAGGMVGLGCLPGGRHDSKATAVSKDGLVVVGYSGHEAFRWTAAGGMVGLGGLYPMIDSIASAVSSNGSVVVGWSQSATSGPQAFRWTADGGMVGLGYLAGGPKLNLSYACAVSEDGIVVLGQADSASGDTAFVWDRANGMRNLQSVLTNDYHLDLTGWKLGEAKGISLDGKTIVGNGKHNGHHEAWVAHLDRPLNAPAQKK